MFPLYTLLYTAALAVLLPFEFMKRPAGLRKKWLREKLGAMDPSGLRQGNRFIWVHAVSVGEVIASVPFINALKGRHPKVTVVVSTVTDTGRKVAGERLKDIADVIYMPFDIPFLLKRVARRINPSVFIVMETEIWPNAFKTMKTAGVPVIVLNGRISEASFRGYARIRFFMKKVLGLVDLFCMQDDTYAKRIGELGAEDKKIVNTGSFKFDIKVKHDGVSWASLLRGPVIVAGSTHRGEDEIILSAYRRLREEFHDLNLVLAPRHPERFGEVEELLRGAGVSHVRRTGLDDSMTLSGCVVLLDTVGELSSVYGISDVAVMGGSFIDRGGQNPLEPAAHGKPVVCGPHMHNFPFIKEFYAEGAALQADGDNLHTVVRDVLKSPEKRAAIGARARAIMDANRGAVERAVNAVEKFLPHKP